MQLEKLPSSSTRTSINLEFRPDEINDGILISTRKSFINSSFRRPLEANKTGFNVIFFILVSTENWLSSGSNSAYINLFRNNTGK